MHVVGITARCFAIDVVVWSPERNWNRSWVLSLSRILKSPGFFIDFPRVGTLPHSDVSGLWHSVLGTLFPTACHHDSTECINTQYYLRWAVESERTAKAGDFDVAETHGFVVVLLIYLHIYVTRIVWFPVVTIIIVTVCYRSNSLLSWSWHKRSIVWKT